MKNAARKKAKTWGDVYNAALRRGEDHGSAAERADRWEKNKNKTTESVLGKLENELRAANGVISMQDDSIAEHRAEAVRLRNRIAELTRQVDQSRGRPPLTFPENVAHKNVEGLSVNKIGSYRPLFKFDRDDLMSSFLRPSIAEDIERAVKKAAQAATLAREISVMDGLFRRQLGMRRLSSISDEKVRLLGVDGRSIVRLTRADYIRVATILARRERRRHDQA